MKKYGIFFITIVECVLAKMSWCNSFSGGIHGNISESRSTPFYFIGPGSTLDSILNNEPNYYYKIGGHFAFKKQIYFNQNVFWGPKLSAGLNYQFQEILLGLNSDAGIFLKLCINISGAKKIFFELSPNLSITYNSRIFKENGNSVWGGEEYRAFFIGPTLGYGVGYNFKYYEIYFGGITRPEKEKYLNEFQIEFGIIK